MWLLLAAMLQKEKKAAEEKKTLKKKTQLKYSKHIVGEDGPNPGNMVPKDCDHLCWSGCSWACLRGWCPVCLVICMLGKSELVWRADGERMQTSCDQWREGRAFWRGVWSESCRAGPGQTGWLQEDTGYVIMSEIACSWYSLVVNNLPLHIAIF